MKPVHRSERRADWTQLTKQVLNHFTHLKHVEIKCANWKQRNDVCSSLFASRPSLKLRRGRRTNSCKHLCVFSLQRNSSRVITGRTRAGRVWCVQDSKNKGKVWLVSLWLTFSSGAQRLHFSFSSLLPFLPFLHESFLFLDKSEVFARLLSVFLWFIWFLIHITS